MPVKWDSVKDQHILMQLINDPSTNITNQQYDNIVATWPTTLGDPPTVRAIKEHFIKVKIDLKKANAGPEATPSKSAAGASPDKTFPVTPSTGGKKRSAAAKSPQSRKKRKGGMSEESEASMTGEETDAMQGVEEDIVSPRVMPGRRTKTGVVVKEESTDDESGVGEKSEATSGEDSEGSTFKEQQE